MRRRMAVKVEADNLCARRTVAQHTFGTVAEGQHHNAVRTDGGRGGKAVHGGIIERLLHHIAAYPRIHYARTVDAEQDAVARPSGRMVHMHERIDTRLRVGLRRIDNTIHHAARTSRRGHLARLQNIQREGVVWLVARTVRYRCTLRYAEQLFRCGIGLGLRADRRPGLGYHLMRNAVPVGHEVGTTLLGKVPQYLFRQAAHARREVSRQPIGYIVSGQHELVDVREQLGFVALDPRQLRGREVSGRVERMAKTVVAAYAFESLGSDLHGTRVAPDDRLAQRVPRSIETHQTVHLIGYAYRHDVTQRTLGPDLTYALAYIMPPHVGVLLRPSAPKGIYRHLLRGVCRRGDALSRRYVEQRHLHRRGAYIYSQTLHILISFSFVYTSFQVPPALSCPPFVRTASDGQYFQLLMNPSLSFSRTALR